MLKKVENMIDKIPMYKILVYSLLAISVYGMVFSTLGIASFEPIAGLLSLLLFVSSGLLFNYIIGFLFKIKPHQLSQLITSLILFLLFTPELTVNYFFLSLGVSFFSVISKYIFTWRLTHIFNPAAAAAFLSTLVFGNQAFWWVGSAYMLPITLLIALVVLRKQRKFTLAGLFMAASALVLYVNYGGYYDTLLDFLREILISWPLIFFVSVMVTEPFTLPSRKKYEYAYVVFIALLANSNYHVWRIGASPEFALIVANLLSYLLLQRSRYKLSFVEKIKLSEDMFEFVFNVDKKMQFKAGQYLELAVPHEICDSRGERRYFTISSAPNEAQIKFGIKIMQAHSTFKDKLLNLEPNDTLCVEQIRGDFVIDSFSEKYIFIAGGIGITPFISILRNLLFKKEKLDAVLVYLVNRDQDIVYKDVIDSALQVLGVKTIVVVAGPLTHDKIKSEIPDYLDRKIYISGPPGMVSFYKDHLSKIGISLKNIVVDFFNGY